MTEPLAYRLEHARDALAQDERVGALDVRIVEVNGTAVLSGLVSTSDRRTAIEDVVRKALPDLDIRNEIDVEELDPPHAPEILP